MRLARDRPGSSSVVGALIRSGYGLGPMVPRRLARHGCFMTSDYSIAGPEVHVIPVGRTSTWRVHDGDPSEPASEHMSTTAAEAAAYSRATERGADRIVIHDRYHRIRLVDPEAMPDQHPEDSTAPEKRASDEGSLRPTVDQMGEWSFPASDPPATWTWDPPPAQRTQV